MMCENEKNRKYLPLHKVFISPPAWKVKQTDSSREHWARCHVLRALLVEKYKGGNSIGNMSKYYFLWTVFLSSLISCHYNILATVNIRDKPQENYFLPAML